MNEDEILIGATHIAHKLEDRVSYNCSHIFFSGLITGFLINQTHLQIFNDQQDLLILITYRQPAKTWMSLFICILTRAFVACIQKLWTKKENSSLTEV